MIVMANLLKGNLPFFKGCFGDHMVLENLTVCFPSFRINWIRHKKALSSNESEGFSTEPAAQNCLCVQFVADN